MSEVALIGSGNMGQALIRGWLESGALEPSEIVICEPHEGTRDHVKIEYGVHRTASAREAAETADLVFLAVKPPDSLDILEQLAGVMRGSSALVSIVAGLRIETIRDILGPVPSVVRVMPNMGAAAGASMSAYAVSEGEGQLTGFFVVLLESVGEVARVDEEHLDLVTAVSGSGPAYFFMMVEALEEAGASRGLPRQVARKLSRQTLWGAASVLKESGRDASELREAVSSPGGTTLAALEILERKGLREALDQAVEAARNRAGELSS